MPTPLGLDWFDRDLGYRGEGNVAEMCSGGQRITGAALARVTVLPPGEVAGRTPGGVAGKTPGWIAREPEHEDHP